MTGQPARVALVGAHGYGAIHRRNLARLELSGRARLVAVAEPTPVVADELPEGTRVHSDLASLLEAEDALDVVIVSTPLHTHFELAELALASGADLYLEKPPVTSLAQFRRLRELAAGSGRLVQVGFQSLGSHAVPWLRDAVDAGDLGEVRAITAVGSWTRDRGYFRRSRWAGRRVLDGVDVVDGVATNALSHAILTALSVAGAGRETGNAVTVDLHRANDTQSDDTTVVRVRREAGKPSITCALTLCGPEEAEPEVTVHGSDGTATLRYVLDEIVIENRTGTRTLRFDRTDLLENLVDARAGSADLLCSLDDTAGYLDVLEAVRLAPDPAPIPEDWVSRIGEGDRERVVVHDIETTLRRAVAAEATFLELGTPWAPLAPGEPVLHAEPGPDGSVLAEHRSGAALAASLSPRPYLHPVRTRAGVALTDHQPLDHPWHLGVGIALPDVAGANLWGGPDYRSDTGDYRWGRTHGRGEAEKADGDAARLRQEVLWRDAAGARLLHEKREWRCELIDDVTWRLGLRFELRAAGQPVVLGSPGSHGRRGAGYGGFFWRFAPGDRIEVHSRDASGEEALNGSRTPWLLWRGIYGSASASVLFVAPEASDPWFVRTGEYPGVGSALAWDRARTVGGDPLVRSLSMYICDGELSHADAERLATRP